MARHITLHEGECERSIIEWLKPQGYLFGRMIKLVLSEIKSIERSLYKIDHQTIVTVVMDCDTFFSKEANTERLRNNIKWLLHNSRKLRIITQNKNLEDELIKALGLRNHLALYQHFNTSNKATYKQTLANMIPEKLDIKLAGFDFEVFWNDKILNRFYQEQELIVLNCTLNDVK